jgi:dTDP-4-dehydrorhamnose reductase
LARKAIQKLMNILVFGKDGQLGRAFQALLGHLNIERSHQVLFVGRADCDLESVMQVHSLLDTFKPDLIINAAAYTAVDKAEAEPDRAFAINAVAPEVMARYAAVHSATLLHFSTDYVFDGAKVGRYQESDPVNPLGAYGKSKAAGESAIVKAFTNSVTGHYAVLRTSWVYGDGGNFIRTILRLAEERNELKIVADQYGVPTSAELLAEVGLHLVLDDGSLRNFKSGIYHATPLGETSWHGLAQLVVRSARNLGISLLALPEAVRPIPASEFPLPAPRPMNSRLATQKLESELERLGIVSKLPHWKTPWDRQVMTYLERLIVDKNNSCKGKNGKKS